jgi:hypothetical protein
MNLLLILHRALLRQRFPFALVHRAHRITDQAHHFIIDAAAQMFRPYSLTCSEIACHTDCEMDKLPADISTIRRPPGFS